MKVRRACEPVMEGGTYADISHPTAKAVPDQFFWLDDYELDRTTVTKGSARTILPIAGFGPTTGAITRRHGCRWATHAPMRHGRDCSSPPRPSGRGPRKDRAH